MALCGEHGYEKGSIIFQSSHHNLYLPFLEFFSDLGSSSAAGAFLDLRFRSRNREPRPLLAALVSLRDCCCGGEKWGRGGLNFWWKKLKAGLKTTHFRWQSTFDDCLTHCAYAPCAPLARVAIK